MTNEELAAAVAVKKTTMANKAGLINRILDLSVFEADLTRIEVLERHPLAWLVEVDGFILDARSLPPDLLAEARRRGLVPDLEALRAA